LISVSALVIALVFLVLIWSPAFVAIVVSPFTTAVGKKHYTVREPQVGLSSAVDTGSGRKA
jgi:hypothetical protein